MNNSSILDFVCFQRDDIILELPVFNSDNPTVTEVFVLDANVTVGFYFRLICANTKINQTTDEFEKLNLIKDVACDVLNLDKRKNVTAYDIEKKFDNYKLLNDLYSLALLICNNLSRPDLFSVPEIKLDKEPEPTAVERILSKDNTEVELMEGIVYVTMQTNNSYSDVMNMPFTVFQSFLKHIKILNNISIPEWKEKYLQAKYKIKLQSENQNSTHKKKLSPDLDGLKKLGGLING